MSAALVSIIGPPGSGKTTAAEWLCGALPARLLREDYAGNPFLAEAYLGRSELALPAQLYFLFSRVSQLSRQTWPREGLAVSDYGFCQDAIYAAGNLSGPDLATYRRLAEPAASMVKPPDLLVHLDAKAEVLLERIALRGRRHEAVFTAEFLNRLRRAYEGVCQNGRCPVVHVEVASTDLLAAGPRQVLLERIREALP